MPIYQSPILSQIGFLLSLPRLPSMVEKEDFEIEGLDFMVCDILLFFVYLLTRCHTQRCFASPWPVFIRGQTSLPQPENQRARQPSGRLALWHQRCDTCLISLVNTVNYKQYISAKCVFHRHGDCSDDTAAELDSWEERLSLQGVIKFVFQSPL